MSFNLEDHKFYAKITQLSKSSDPKSLFKEISAGINRLKVWFNTLPPHLQLNATIPPPHRRPICLLHLRYWSTIISVTRLALLADVQSMLVIYGADQRPKLNLLAQLCIDASENAHHTLEYMHSTGVLSSLTAVDTKHILDVAMVSLLLLTRWRCPVLQQRLERCMEILKSMDNIGFCKFGGADLLAMIRSYNALFCGSGDDLANPDAPMMESRIQPDEADL